jgi:hypothetical protein
VDHVADLAVAGGLQHRRPGAVARLQADVGVDGPIVDLRLDLVEQVLDRRRERRAEAAAELRRRLGQRHVADARTDVLGQVRRHLVGKLPDGRLRERHVLDREQHVTVEPHTPTVGQVVEGGTPVERPPVRRQPLFRGIQTHGNYPHPCETAT